MKLRLAGSNLDTDARPLVVADPGSDFGADASILATAKDLVRQGADAVLVRDGDHRESLVDALDTLDLPPATIDVSPETSTRTIRIGDHVEVPVIAASGLGPIPHRTGAPRPVIVDLGAEADRAVLAAQVAAALEGGAVGFLTVAPSPVRRAAYVIRAVENAR